MKKSGISGTLDRQRLYKLGSGLLAILVHILFPVLSVPCPAFSDDSDVTGRFMNDLSLDLRPRNYSTIVSAVKSYAVQGSNCSLVFTSNDGHALTARHCIDDPLRKNNLAEIQQVEGMDVNLINKAKVINKTIPIQISETLTITKDLFENPSLMRAYLKDHAPKVYAAQVLSIGNGALLRPNSEDLSSEQVDALRRNDLDVYSDYLLIKLPIKNTPCVKTKVVKKDEPVFSLGFPTRGPGTMGYGKSISVGKVCESINIDRQIEQMNVFARALYGKTLKASLNAMIEKYQPEVTFHSAIMARGASGGGLFSLDGHLVGINSFVLLNASEEKNYTPGAYASLSIDKIKQLLAKDLTADEVAAAFNCEDSVH